MATKPADETYTPPSANTDRPARQEAAVKGITPDQPAPIVEPKATPAPAPVPESQPGLLARIFAFFRGEKQPEPAPVVAQPEAPRRESRPRSDRSNNRKVVIRTSTKTSHLLQSDFSIDQLLTACDYGA